MTQSVLELVGISAGYNGPPVVRDVSIAVEAGEIVGIFGANGAGKTTTLRVASGLLSATAGTVLLDGSAVTGVTAQALARRGVAHVPEGRGVFHSLTVEEHLRLAPPRMNIDREVAYTMFPALRSLAKRRAGLLSGGEQQMLSLARALARRPRVLLIDELSLGLAPVIVRRLLPLIRSFADDGGAVVVVEQHVSMALRIVDRAYILSHGEVVHHDRASSLEADRTAVLEGYLGRS